MTKRCLLKICLVLKPRITPNNRSLNFVAFCSKYSRYSPDMSISYYTFLVNRFIFYVLFPFFPTIIELELKLF